MADKKSYCNRCKANGVETEIIWNQNNKSQSGKMIPMDVNGQNHNCAFYSKTASKPAPTPEQSRKDFEPVGKQQNISPEAIGARTSEEQASLNRLETDLGRVKQTVERIEKSLTIVLLSLKPVESQA